MSPSGKWGDLRTRVLSGVAVALVGLGAVWLGGAVLEALAVAVAALGVWELARLTAPGRQAIAMIAAALAVLGLGLNFHFHGPFWLPALTLPAAVGLIGARRDRVVYIAYALALMLAVHVLVGLREGRGLAFVLWLIAVVVLSDLLGYFGGRMIGGPKFWPRLSPKKTWSGTLSGWAGAAAAGLAFAVWSGDDPAALLLLSVATAFAAQMGDIAESAIKRRAGVKDASGLIPGHGGVLDRFDALIGALLFLLAWLLAGLPLPALTV
jgi:phosphatidate cytidylyltransferase